MAKPVVEEVALTFDVKSDGSMKIDRVTIRDGKVFSREPWLHDISTLVMNRLEQHIRHAVLTGGQI